ncbi:gamma secretase complex protein [Linnemannia hyalina]|uniref:Gamma secretase complex protein n=1 Tax=Linnemannia hyalina TaxID=64524 RepID=A0A9P7XNL7_9FUNG|nr:gamma secretase complex protein [Linnemannia hyalina]
MTLTTFFGCAFTAYGPSLAIFFGSIAPNAQLVILMVSSRAESGLNMVAMHPKSRFNRSGYAFAAGLGFGLMFGIISYITQLVDSLGPGVIMCESCKTVSLYFISGFTNRSWLRIAWVVITHYGASYLTILNSSPTINYGCAYQIIGNVALLIASTIIVFADMRQLHQKLS